MTRLTRRLTLAAFAAALCGSASSIAGAEDKDLIIFEWSGYEAPEFHPAYAEKHGDEPTFTFFGDEEEAFQKIRSGFKTDLSHPCSQSVVKWREAGLLQPLDTSKIAGWKDINPGILAMKDLATDKDGTVWFMPWDWGNTILTYNSEKVTEAEAATLKSFADPKFKDRVTIGDNVDDAYALASLVIGLKDWTKMTDAQFAEASAFLREVHKNVRLYWTDNTEVSQAMASGEVDLAWAWNETANVLKTNGVPVESKRDTDEGLSSWVCGYVLLKDAPGNLDKAYAFLNATLAPDVSNYLVTAWGYGHANGKGMAAVDPAALQKTGFDDIAKFVDKTLFGAPMDPVMKQKFTAEFEKIKAGY